MTIDEAIENLKYDIEIDMYIHDIAPQIAELLEELKSIKEMDLSIPQHFTKEQSEWIKSYCIRRNIEFYNKALNDFAEKMKYEYGSDEIHETIDEIAEQLKAGGENGKLSVR